MPSARGAPSSQLLPALYAPLLCCCLQGMRVRDLKMAIADKTVNDGARDFDLLIQNAETRAGDFSVGRGLLMMTFSWSGAVNACRGSKQPEPRPPIEGMYKAPQPPRWPKITPPRSPRAHSSTSHGVLSSAVYTNDNELVPKNTRVIVTRQAAAAGKGLRGNAVPKHLTTAGFAAGQAGLLRGLGGGGLGAGGLDGGGPGGGQDSDVARSLSTVSRIAEAAVLPGMEAYARQAAGRAHYAARRAAAGLKEGEELPVRLKGVPQKFQHVNEDGVATLRANDDKFAAQLDRVSDALAPGGAGGEGAGSGGVDYGDALPHALTCPLCKQLVRDAVVLQWAKLSACEPCVRAAMREGDGVCPLTDKKVRAWQDQLVPNKPLRRDAASFALAFAEGQRAKASAAAEEAAAEAAAAEAELLAAGGPDGGAGGRNAGKRVGVDAELDFGSNGGLGLGGGLGAGPGDGFGGFGDLGGGGLYDDFLDDDAAGFSGAAAAADDAPAAAYDPTTAPTGASAAAAAAAAVATAAAGNQGHGAPPAAATPPLPGDEGPRPPVGMPQPLPKREQCREFARGSCARGAACVHAHGDSGPAPSSFGSAQSHTGASPPAGGDPPMGSPPVGPPPPGPPPPGPPPMRGAGLGGYPGEFYPGDGAVMGGKGMVGQQSGWGPGGGQGMGWDAGGKGFGGKGAMMGPGPMMGKGGWGPGPMHQGGWGGDWGGGGGSDWNGGMGKGGWVNGGGMAMGKGGKGGASWEPWGAKRGGPEAVGGELKRGRGEGF